MSSVATLSLQNQTGLVTHKVESEEDVSFELQQIIDLRKANKNLKHPLSEAIFATAKDHMPDLSKNGKLYFLAFKTGNPQQTFHESWRVSSICMKNHMFGQTMQNYIRLFKPNGKVEERFQEPRVLCWIPIDFISNIGKSVADVRNEFSPELLVSNSAIIAAKYLDNRISTNIIIPGYEVKRPRAYNGNGWDKVISITLGKRRKVEFGKEDVNFKNENYTVPVIDSNSEKIEIGCISLQ